MLRNGKCKEVLRVCIQKTHHSCVCICNHSIYVKDKLIIINLTSWKALEITKCYRCWKKVNFQLVVNAPLFVHYNHLYLLTRYWRCLWDSEKRYFLVLVLVLSCDVNTATNVTSSVLTDVQHPMIKFFPANNMSKIYIQFQLTLFLYHFSSRWSNFPRFFPI